MEYKREKKVDSGFLQKDMMEDQEKNQSSVSSPLSSAKLYRMIEFAVKHGNCGGSLVQFQQGGEMENALPFNIGKVLVSSDMQPGDVRGNHAHYETEEIIVALSGGCTFELDDGKGTRERVRLGVGECGSVGVRESDTPTPIPPYPDTQSALLLYPHIWRTFYDFEPNTVLLLVANMKYDEADYIRDRTEFEFVAKTWSALGGSSENDLECGGSTPL